MLQGFHTPLLFPIQYNLKLNLLFMTLNIIYKKVNLSKQTQNITLCQQDLKGYRINTKFGFGEELSMQSNFIRSVHNLSSWSVCESRGAKSLSEKILKVRKISFQV